MLIGEKVILRPLEREDTALIVKWRNIPRIMASLFGHLPLSRADHENWFEGYTKNPLDMVFVIETKDRVPVGTVGLTKIDYRNQCAEFGRLLIGEDEFMGQGLAKDATMTLVRFAFSELNLNRLFIEAFAFNRAPIEVCGQCGFEIEGTKRECVFTGGKLRDVVIMGLLRRDFFAKFGDQ